MEQMAIILPPEKLPELLQVMLKHPESRSHMLFLGPPGSSKTTTAQSFATALHGKTCNRFASLLFMNSSDERSLETMRTKVYPFVESRMQTLFFTEDPPPKVIIFDEAETLTDQAQCALRPLLHRDTKEVILIFICNSLSHIHPQILNKFLIVPFIPTAGQSLNTITGLTVPKMDALYRRGDIRFFKQCPQDKSTITQFLFRILHAKGAKEVFNVMTSPGSPLRERITWFLLFHQMMTPLETREIALWSAASASETHNYLDPNQLQTLLYKLWKQRMESLVS